jgi:hypothetical protein
MKFVNVITQSTQYEIDEILYSMSLDNAKQIEKIYSMFDFVEYTSKNGFECMFCIVDENDLLALSKSYNKFDIKHDFFDLTKNVFYDNKFPINFKNQYGLTVKSKVSKLIEKFKIEFTTSDIILDKILEKGIDSLTDFDKSVLESV